MAIIKCPECGHDVSSMATSCPNCGYPISSMEPAEPEHMEEQTRQNDALDEFDMIDSEPEQKPKEPSAEKPKEASEARPGCAITCIVILIIIAVVISLSAKTHELWNKNKNYGTSTSSYSSSSSHSSGTSGYGSAEEEFKILYLELEDLELKSSDYKMYMILSGAVRNTGTKTCYFVKVKTTFYDENGISIDIGDTYACGAEGIAPGESSKFEIRVDYDERIETSRTKIYDCD